MQHFVPATGGWESLVEAWERELIAGLLEQVLFVLTSQGGPSQEAHRPGTGQRSGESERDSQILASLDFAMEDAAGQSRTTHSPRADAELTSLLEVLLPEASEDPLTAVEVASITRERLRSLKVERARIVMAQLREPTGQGASVRVEAGTEQDWLGALNDLRLVLAQRLGIEDAQAAEDVHAVAWEDPPQEESETERSRRAMSMVYDMLTWWQESLLTVLLSGDGPA